MPAKMCRMAESMKGGKSAKAILIPKKVVPQMIDMPMNAIQTDNGSDLFGIFILLYLIVFIKSLNGKYSSRSSMFLNIKHG